MRRRQYLAVLGTGATAALAGCAGRILSDTDAGEIETDTASTTQKQVRTTTEQTTTKRTTTEQTTTKQPTTKQTTTEEEREENNEHVSRPITEYQLAVHDTRENGYPVWIDRNGRLYGRHRNEVRVSDDWWVTTKPLYAFPDVDKVNDGYVQMVVVPDNGNVIVAVGGRSERGSRIYRLDDDLNGATKLYEFEDGRVLNSMNHVVYEDVIVMASYMLSDFEAGRYGNEVILSTDGGTSFDRILEVPLDTTDAANLHIHDVEYDPYADRIWVVVGDNGNSQMYWSDDLGSSWETIADRGDVTMMTQIAAFEDCVAFGTDGYPEGIIRWERTGPNDEPAGVDDLDLHVQIETDSPGKPMEMYARRRWHIREDDGRELCLMPFGFSPMDDGANESVVLASVDGNVWYELYRAETRETLLTNVMGPLSMDGDRRTLVSDSNQPPGYQIDATVPKFWK